MRKFFFLFLAQFPTIQYELQKEIKKNMERIVCEEKFIKDETAQIDQCLRRCKTLANMMVTMKKLAMVQDPTLNLSSKFEKNNNRPLFTLKENEFTRGNHLSKFMKNEQINGNQLAVGEKQRLMIDEKVNEQTSPPAIPPPPIYYEGIHIHFIES